ncbi:MAG: AAA family ATPase [Bacteroidetes bacterium]|nr:AAA family ATPase [Bacteroidota bacterium]
MPIEVKIIGHKDTPEYEAGLQLKKLFEEQTPQTTESGSILIATNITLFGQEVKDIDIIVLGKFGKGFFKKLKFRPKNEDDFKFNNVYFNSFCLVIELKSHLKEDVGFNNLSHLLVSYNDKFHDVTYQSEKQKYSLLRFFKNFDEIGYSPYIVNLIWLNKINSGDLINLAGSREHNYLPSEFKIDWLLQLLCVQNKPYHSTKNEGKEYYTFNAHKNLSGGDFSNFEKAFNLFTEVKSKVGNITRQHFERLNKKILRGQNYADAILNRQENGKFVIFSGRAGTGKTVKLLTVASDLCVNHGYRCLILTFNFALVADLRRTLTLAGIPDSAGEESVRITTLYKFFIDLLEGFEIFKKADLPDDQELFNNYPKYCKSLVEYIEQKQQAGLELEMKENQQSLYWDYVLIDEAQDWLNEEIELLYKIFGHSKIIIARAPDQMVRSGSSAKWIRPKWKPNIDYVQTNEKKSYRQKVNLVKFVNSFAEKFNLPGWELEPNEEFVGGRVIITSQYNYELHQIEYERCKENGNRAYEMMFIVPNSLIIKGHKTINIKSEGFDDDVITKTIKTSYCKLVDDFAGKIDFWDGTNKELRREYPVKVDQHRIIGYEACRGLEGWTVVCMDLDDFINFKTKYFKEEEEKEQTTLALETYDEKREKYINLWALIPLTRAIDTLIITIKDKNSPFAKRLYEVYRANSDFVEWNI